MYCEQIKQNVDVFRDESSEVLFWDSQREIRYLKGVDQEKKFPALKQELETAMQELFWVQGGAKLRVLEEDRIRDPVSGSLIDTIVESGNNPLEIKAFESIQNSLSGGAELVIHFSPRNIELGYNDNVVDFWMNDREKGKILYLRCFVQDEFDQLRKIYSFFGGESLSSPSGMLENPLVIDGFSLAQVQRNLTMVDKKVETTNERIIDVTNKLLDKFYKHFRGDIFKNKELIDRIYSGIQEVIFKGKSLDDIEIQKYIHKEVDKYMFAPIIGIKIRQNGSCPGKNITVEFGPGRGMIVSVVNGELTFKEGETKDLKFCKLCGYFYLGEKCPLCNP